jgi:hypothetical protein
VQTTGTANFTLSPPPAFMSALMLPFNGSGPLGMVTAQDVSKALQEVTDSASATWPRVQRLLQQPGAREIATAMSTQLAKRFTARAIKLVFAGQQLATGDAGPGSNGSVSTARS